MPQRLGRRTLSARDKLAIAGFLFFAVIIGGVAGYMAYWAQQEADATFADEDYEDPVPVVSVHPAEPADEAIDPSEFEGETPLESEDATDRDAEDDVSGSTEAAVRPRIAIVIDDWGYDWAAAPSFIAFPERLTVAVLPFLPMSVAQAERALEAGHEVIVHMPMEPQNSEIDLGPGGVYVTMDEDAIAEAVAAALAAVPGAVGLNNHMGSRATTEPDVMRTVLGVLREHDKFFVDSFTTPATVGPAVARELSVPYAVNQVFLDHEDDEEHIRRQIQRLADLARERGAAVGIGHVRPRTYQALMDMLPWLQAEGFEFVTVSQLLQVPTPTAGPGPDEAPVSSDVPSQEAATALDAGAEPREARAGAAGAFADGNGIIVLETRISSVDAKLAPMEDEPASQAISPDNP